MPTRAPSMSVDQRRAQLETAAVQVLRRHGRSATTKDIAAAAGVAEGTIFRVFDTKDELVQAALIRAFDPEPLSALLRTIDPDAPLQRKVLDIVTAHQRHLTGLFELMTAVGMMRPPESVRNAGHASHRGRQEQTYAQMVALIAPEAHLLRISPEQLVRVLRLLTFSGSNPHIAHGELLRPEEIVDVVLDGALRPDGDACTSREPTSC